MRKFLTMISIALVLLLIPVIIAWFMHFEVFSYALGDANGWLGYWGGFLGASISAATVYIVTSQQVKAQKKLHEENLVEQIRLHEINLEKQREIQMESITESAKLSDRRQRELIIANMRLDKIESIVQELMIIQGVSSERFNILRTYNQYHHERKKIEIKLIKERDRRKLIKFLSGLKEIKVYEKTIKVSKTKLKNKKHKNYNVEKAITKLNNLDKKCNDLLDKETEKRNVIIISSAKLKTESLFVKLDDDLNSFRGFITEVLEFFSNLIRRDDKREDEFYSLIDFYEDEFLKRNNRAIGLCTRKMNGEVENFRNPDN
ncbi:hypothetical protein [Peribacillus loiseleuriae]|uniref:hypothetical protein n=1 Tax=Peribacillus loiseleuriae TaxID=1679170 RepID=UPI003D03D56A